MKKEGRKRLFSNKSKKSQLTIFVIIAIAIVAVIIIAFYPQIKNIFIPPAPGELVPRDCIKNAVFDSLNRTMLHGGSLNPELYFRYNNYSIQYLCYTQEWYKTCVMQKPFIKQSVEAEVNKDIQKKIGQCFSQMEDTLKSRGYDIQVSGSKVSSLNILPGRINFSIDMTMTLKKNEETVGFDSNMFKFDFNSKAYDLLIITSSIQNYEARYGDSAPEIFMQYYPEIKIEKLKQDDGTKVYKLTQRNTGEFFQFATRSLAWPPGWAFNPTFTQ